MSEHEISTEPTGVIVVDLQGDFTELRSGSLAVSGTDLQYIEAVRKATNQLYDKGLPVYFTQDWHPADHVSFFTNNPGTEPLQVIEKNGRSQVMWPPHCVQGTPGADILIPIRTSAKIVQKGMNPKYDSYSGFADDGGLKTELDSLLRQDRISQLMVYGLATDYCVNATVMDALQGGYKVTLFGDLCRGVAPDTTDAAINKMKEHGVTVANYF